MLYMTMVLVLINTMHDKKGKIQYFMTILCLMIMLISITFDMYYVGEMSVAKHVGYRLRSFEI